MTGPIDSSNELRPTRSRKGWIIAIVIIVVVIGGIYLIVQRSKRAQSADQGFDNTATAVAIAAATQGDLAVNIPALGTVTPLATVTVKTQISGQLTQVAFKEGQMVHEGDFLAQIDPRPYQASLDQAQAALRRDQALLANAKVDLARYQGLVAEDSIAKQQLDTQVSLVEQYEGTVAADQAQIETAKVNLQYCHIVAPVSGRLGLRQVDPGNYVTPGDSNGLVVVTQLQPITVIFPVPEDYMGNISRKLKSGTVLAVQAFDRTNTTKLADGKLLTLDNVIDNTTGTVKLRALFENKDETLFANQFVNVILLEDTLHDQVIIPGGAVHHGSSNGGTSTFVYLVNKADSSVSVRPVTTGLTDGERIAVTSGLKVGDVVVTEGADRLRDGAKVTLPGATPQPANRGPRRGGPPGGGPRF